MSTDATDAQGSTDARRAVRLFLAPLICVMVCLVLFPTFTVLYVAWAQAENNHKFCVTVNAVVSPAPPAGPAASNPARAYEQDLHAAFLELKERLGC